MPGHLIDGPDDHLNFAQYGLEGEGGDTDPLATAQVQEQPPAQTPAPAAQELPADDGVPEKYRGKSAQELLDIVRNQETLIGRQSNELGDLRQQTGTLQGLVDKALSLHDPAAGRQDHPGDESSLSEDDFREDPVGATSRVVRDAVKQETAPLQEQVSQLTAANDAASFQARHPSAATDINSQEFIDFCQGSEYRKNLALKAFGDHANGNYDFTAADELWQAWEDKQPASATSGEAAPTTPVQSTKEAAPIQEPPSMVPAGSGGGEPGADGKPRYSWQGLQDLQAKNPDYYWRDDVQAQINAAIAEGRVR
jgi:hypothetical protein